MATLSLKLASPHPPTPQQPRRQKVTGFLTSWWGKIIEFRTWGHPLKGRVLLEEKEGGKD
jgi:hypothetical protein